MYTLLNDKMEIALKSLEDNSIDSIITDPPYGINFMAKQWDYDVPSKEMWEECLRVLKPGGHLLSFSSARTYHRMVIPIEDAGFEIRDQIMWCYNSGFPKSHNIGKTIEKRKGNAPDKQRFDASEMTAKGDLWERDGKLYRKLPDINGSMEIGKGDGKQANTPVYLEVVDFKNEWDGWGTAIKPAHEPIAVCRKPLSEKTVASNAERWGTGGLNIEASRVGEEVISTHHAPKGTFAGGELDRGSDTSTYKDHKGRWPANLIHDGIWDDKDHGKFYFVPKVSKKERNEGLEGVIEETRKPAGDFRPSYDQDGSTGTPHGRWGTDLNTHPTVKPIALMHYLTRMVTPTYGTVLDPFMGSGSTGCACVSNGYRFVGVEMEEKSFNTAEARIKYWNTKSQK